MNAHTERKDYAKPVIRDWGTVRDLTATSDKVFDLCRIANCQPGTTHDV